MDMEKNENFDLKKKDLFCYYLHILCLIFRTGYLSASWHHIWVVLHTNPLCDWNATTTREIFVISDGSC